MNISTLITILLHIREFLMDQIQRNESNHPIANWLNCPGKFVWVLKRSTARSEVAR